MKLRRKNSWIFMLLFLGTLSAFGPFVMDMYLPTLPEMTDYFGTSSALVQLGLTTSMIGLSAGQLFFGPLSDRLGRRKPLIFSMVLFIISTLGCIFAGNIWIFIAMRFVQGFAGSGGVVLSRSIATDKYSAAELATMLGLIGSVNGIATVAAPVAGGIAAGIAGWRGIFWCLLLLGAVLLAGSIKMREPLSGSKMKKNSREAFLGGFRDIIRNRTFLLSCLRYGLAMSIVFINVASTPFIMQEHYGLTQFQFSLMFGINAVGMAVASAAATKFSSMEKAMRVSAGGMLLVSIGICAALLCGCKLWLYELLLFLVLGMSGMAFTATNALAMESTHDNAGIGSAILGMSGYIFGCIVPPLVGAGDMALTSGILFVVCSALSFLSTTFRIRPDRNRPFPADSGQDKE